ncbi:AP-1-like transcription factor, partial [Lecanoromycetidae sp. Uapishka_2]
MQPALAPAPHPMRGQQDDVADQAFREQLLANIPGNHQYSSPHRPEHQLSNTANPHHHNIDPAIGGPGGMMDQRTGDSGGEDGSDGRKGGKRELSTSKRAAQNRAAQRAFRQRKEGHIKSLETQVREFNNLSESYKALQAENYQLRDYIITLQSRLLESQGDYPRAPENIDIPHPQASGPPAQQAPAQQIPAPAAPTAPTAHMGSSAASQLASAAQTVSDIGGGRTQHDESPYQRHPPSNRPRGGEDAEMHKTTGSSHVENRRVAA